MIPRTEIHAVEAHVSFADVARSFVESGFSRIPVYEGELDKIIGILYNKDVLKALQEKSEFRIRDHLHPAFFVPSTLPVSEQFKRILGIDTVFFSFSTADEDYHAPNEFFRIHRLHEGLEAWARLWTILGERAR